MRIHYPGQQGGPYGWGQFGANMVRCWRAMGVYADERPFPLQQDIDCVLHPLRDHDFNEAYPQTARGSVNFAMAFFESPLGPNVAANAAKYDVVFVGSTWCKERCAERGIFNTEVLIQGVDRSIFKPLSARTFAYGGKFGESSVETRWDSAERQWRPKTEQFRIFSGGKFEFRKGQDLVIAAFRQFAKTHPEAHLVCAWFNPWPQLIRACLERPDIACRADFQPQAYAQSQEFVFRMLMMVNGIEPHQFTILPQLSHAELAREMANTDCGLFPNRCEGGTNLVLMEYAACGGVVVANLGTGHWDVSSLVDATIGFEEDQNKWAVQKVPWILHGLEWAAVKRGTRQNKPIPTWESAAQQVVTRAEELLCAKRQRR